MFIETSLLPPGQTANMLITANVQYFVELGYAYCIVLFPTLLVSFLFSINSIRLILGNRQVR